MKNYAFEYENKGSLRRKRRGVFVAALCVCLVAALALFALLPGEGLPRKTENALYDEGGFAYTGTLRAGKFSGQGRIEFAEGGWYEGGLAGGRFEGAGAFGSVDGWEFEGTFSGGKPVRGRFRTEESEFEADQESGAYALPEGWRYMGLLGAKGPRGQGTFTFADGAVYQGEFLNGTPGGGQGTYTNAAGMVVYTGGWSGGLFDGEGEYHAPDGSFSYKGSFTGGKFNGQGTLTQKDGKVLAGTWKAGWRTKS